MGTVSNTKYYVDKCSSFDGRRSITDHTTRITLKDYRVGSDRPSYRQTILNGGNATNSMTGRVYSASVQPGSIRVAVMNVGMIPPPVSTSDFCGVGYVWSDMDDNYYPPNIRNASIAIARSHAWSKISVLQSGSLNGYAFLGEFRQTIDLLRNPLKESIKLTESLAKAALAAKNSREVAKNIGDLWLQYRFGVLPLIMDMEDILEILQEKASDRKRERYSTYGSESSSDDTAYENGAGGGVPAICYGYISKTYKSETFLRFGFDTELLESQATRSGRLLGTLSPDKILPGAWELIPWSFLVDYFVNIGDIIQAASMSSSALTYVSESTVDTIEKKLVSNTAVGALGAGSVLSFSPKVVTIKLRKLERSGGNLAIPPLTFSIPGSATRLGNLAALLTKLL